MAELKAFTKHADLKSVKQLECDALALLVVRLDSDQFKAGNLHWHRWEESLGAEPHGLPENGGNSSRVPPYRNVPTDGDWHYFDVHVERMLFPQGRTRGARWICRPDELYLDVGEMNGNPPRRAKIDLLERLTTPCEPSCSFGLIHFSLLPNDERDGPDTLWWGNAITSTFRRRHEQFHLTVGDGSKMVELSRGRPVRAFVEHLFGNPHPSLERSVYSAFMAQCPDQLAGNADRQAEWRQALATHCVDDDRPVEDIGREREARQTLAVGRSKVLVLGRAAAFTQEGPILDGFARNFRSCWAESIVFGLMQHHSLEEFQQRLADFGDPLNKGVERLRRDWLRFRNLLWWSQLSSGTELPQELLSRLRNELGTERLFIDLEGDLATYSEHQHQSALANLQIYGAAIAVFGALATAIGLAGATGPLLTKLLIGSTVLALAVSVMVRIQLQGWPAWLTEPVRRR